MLTKRLKGQNLRYLSPIILEAEFGDTNFSGKFWGQAPDHLIWKYPLGAPSLCVILGPSRSDLKRFFVEGSPKDVRTAKKLVCNNRSPHSEEKQENSLGRGGVPSRPWPSEG